MLESHPIPKIAKTALAYLNGSYQQQLDTIGRQAVEALGLDPEDDWRVDFNAGTVSRDVPDESPKIVKDGSA